MIYYSLLLYIACFYLSFYISYLCNYRFLKSDVTLARSRTLRIWFMYMAFTMQHAATCPRNASLNVLSWASILYPSYICFSTFDRMQEEEETSCDWSVLLNHVSNLRECQTMTTSIVLHRDLTVSCSLSIIICEITAKSSRFIYIIMQCIQDIPERNRTNFVNVRSRDRCKQKSSYTS